MKKSAELVQSALVRRLQGFAQDKVFLRAAGVALWGLVYARAGALGITGAFGSAFVAGVGYDDTLAACLGALLGYLLTADPSGNVGFMVLCAAALGVKFVCGRRWWSAHPNAGWAAAGGLVLLVGLPALVLGGGQPTDYLILGAQGVLSVATAYFLSRLYSGGQPVLARRGRLADVALMVCLCIFAAGLVSLEVGGVSLGKAAAALFSLCAGSALGGSGGAAAGLCCGLAVAFAAGDFATVVALYGLGGLMAGVFRPLGRMGSAVAFVLCGGVVMLGTGRQMSVGALVEIMVGSVAFMALSEPLLGRITRAFAPETAENSAARRAASRRLRQGVQALREIGESTRSVARQLEKRGGPALSALPDAVADHLCRRCPKNALCWVQNYGETQSLFNTLVERARKDQPLPPDQLPDWFRQRCTQPDRLAEAVCAQYRAWAERLAQRRRAGQVRAIVTDQFDGMAMFLEGIEREISSCLPAGARLTARVGEAFGRWGAQPLGLSCFYTGGRRLVVEARLAAEQTRRVDLRTLSRLVGEAAGRALALPQTEAAEGCVVYTLRERCRLRARVEGAQHSQREGSICGDTWRSFSTPDGRLHIILSDGMGCGGGAALDSAMAVSLLARLVAAGADYDSALRMVNSALLVKSGEESLATLDVAVIDLYSGKTTLYKAGAVPTLVRCGKKVTELGDYSTPAGILGGACFEHSITTLRAGDWLVMMSDGATAAGGDWLEEELERHTGDDPRALAEHLAHAAGLRRSDGRSDDITVICALLEAGEE